MVGRTPCVILSLFVLCCTEAANSAKHRSRGAQGLTGHCGGDVRCVVQERQAFGFAFQIKVERVELCGGA